MTLKLPIYLDYHATTPVDPRVFDAMKPYFTELFGNPASGTHAFGWKAEAAVQKAQEQVADLIHADPKEIVWTSGTTESINLSMIGVALHAGQGHIITGAAEHRSVLDTAEYGVELQGLLELTGSARKLRKEENPVSLLPCRHELFGDQVHSI